MELTVSRARTTWIPDAVARRAGAAATAVATTFGRGVRAATTVSREPLGTRTSQVLPGGVMPRTRTGLSERRVRDGMAVDAESFLRSVAAGTATRSTSGIATGLVSNPYWLGSRPISIAAWIAGTKSFVSRFRYLERLRSQKSVEPVPRIAR